VVPDGRYDVIFFAGWLSHVPTSRFDQFWQSLRRFLVERGRVLFVDEHVEEREKETYVDGREDIVERRLRDGSTFWVVKNFLDPDGLERRLGRLDWDCAMHRDGNDWVCGEARPAR